MNPTKQEPNKPMIGALIGAGVAAATNIVVFAITLALFWNADPIWAIVTLAIEGGVNTLVGGVVGWQAGKLLTPAEPVAPACPTTPAEPIV